MSQVVSIAVASVVVAEPYWNLVNSSEKYINLHQYIQPLQKKLQEWKINCKEMLERNMRPVFEKYPHSTYYCVLNAANQYTNMRPHLNKICEAMLTIVERQLNDHLENGIYGSANDESLLKRTEHSKLTNIPAENLFGDLDYSMRRKPNATFRHHSSVSMLKRNKTIRWLKTKSEIERKEVLKQARKQAPDLRNKARLHEKEVVEERKKILNEIKCKKTQIRTKGKIKASQN